jgi:hypothetical protein
MKRNVLYDLAFLGVVRKRRERKRVRGRKCVKKILRPNE